MKKIRFFLPIASRQLFGRGTESAILRRLLLVRRFDDSQASVGQFDKNRLRHRRSYGSGKIGIVQNRFDDIANVWILQGILDVSLLPLRICHFSSDTVSSVKKSYFSKTFAPPADSRFGGWQPLCLWLLQQIAKQLQTPKKRNDTKN